MLVVVAVMMVVVDVVATVATAVGRPWRAAVHAERTKQTHDADSSNNIFLWSRNEYRAKIKNEKKDTHTPERQRER